MAEVKTGLEGVIKYRTGISGTANVSGGSTLGYATGVSYDVADNPIHIFNGTAFAHSKPGRVNGKLTIKHLFVDNTEYANFGSAVGTVTKMPTYVELQVNGVAGTGEDVYGFSNCILESVSRDVPEESEVKEDLSFFFSALNKVAFANRFIT